MRGARVLLIVGGQGFLGEHVAAAASHEWEVWTASRSPDPTDNRALRVDVRDRQEVGAAFARVRPNVVAHLAAISDIDRCESTPALAWAVNVEGARNVAAESTASGARMVLMSSAAVFDGSAHGYHEQDAPNPLSVYGRTKAEAERAVIAAEPSAIVVRISLALGFSRRNGSNSTLNRWVTAWKSGEPVAAPADEYRNPIDSRSVAEVILELARNPSARGVYHAGADDSMSRHEIARHAAEELSFGASAVIEAVNSSRRRAPRGADHFLVSDRLREVSSVRIGITEEVIRRSVSEITEGPVRARI